MPAVYLAHEAFLSALTYIPDVAVRALWVVFKVIAAAGRT
jgi:hypothetical protein